MSPVIWLYKKNANTSQINSKSINKQNECSSLLFQVIEHAAALREIIEAHSDRDITWTLIITQALLLL